MVNRTLIGALCAVTVFVGALMPAAAAISLPERTTVITFRQAVQLPGVQLAAGTYIFERAEPLGPASVVRVFSRDRRIAHFTGFTTFADRPRGMAAHVVVSVGEARPNEPPPITAWWPIGERTGHEFIYSRR